MARELHVPVAVVTYGRTHELFCMLELIAPPLLYTAIATVCMLLFQRKLGARGYLMFISVSLIFCIATTLLFSLTVVPVSIALLAAVAIAWYEKRGFVFSGIYGLAFLILLVTVAAWLQQLAVVPLLF